MSRFIQLHVLTSYPPSNLNRDDLGRPKSVQMGGANRLRISSQALKRAWRKSDLFQDALDGHTGIRSKEIAKRIYLSLTTGMAFQDALQYQGPKIELDNASAKRIAHAMGAVFVDKRVGAEDDDESSEAEDSGKTKKSKKEKKSNLNRDTLISEQMVFYSLAEIATISALIEKYRAEGKAPEQSELEHLVCMDRTTVDLALFGRMLAAKPEFNTEAAAQVAHAITVHAVTVEDDWFSAVDDLNTGMEDRGAGHIGEAAFGAGVFYLYICINREQLLASLNGDVALRDQTLAAFLEAVAKISPTGKQNSFASRAYASYVMAEKGDQQPRSLSLAFLKPVTGDDYGSEAIKRLQQKCEAMDRMYGACADDRLEMHEGNTVTLAGLSAFITA